MSETVMHIGKMKKVDLQGKTTLEFAEQKLLESQKEMDDFFEDAVEWLVEEYYGEYFLANNELYEILEDKKDESFDVAEGTLNPDGSISYIAMFYNGGASLREVLEEIVNKVEK